MLPWILEIAVSMTLLQPPPANAACAALTPAQVSSLIGAARTMPVTASPMSATCMFQNNDKAITVLIATASSPEGAQRVFDAKKRIVSGADVPGWSTPAYAGFLRPAAVVGVLRKQTLTEVKVVDPAQTPEAIAVKLQAVMKEVAVRK
jgi:hypothetical protein